MKELLKGFETYWKVAGLLVFAGGFIVRTETSIIEGKKIGSRLDRLQLNSVILCQLIKENAEKKIKFDCSKMLAGERLEEEISKL